MTTARAVQVSLRNVSKVYAGADGAHVAVSDVTFDVHQGDLLSLVGPSGCGKTTVLKILAALHAADGGEVRTRPGGLRVGMVFQQPLLLKWRTILENVMLPAEILHLPRDAACRRGTALLEMVGLGGYGGRFPHELSGGMQQRAAIARALVHDPELLLMDEPFGALDALTRERINLELLRIWQESGKTIVFVTHSVQEAVFLGTHCAVLTAGPARMADYFPIDLPHPRGLAIRATPEFGALVQRIYGRLGMA
jgi:NitT/TauT family transport system ATP-binding protein